MMSLWSLFSPRTRMRCYALLDAQGTCRALRESHQPPAEPGWIEVRELRNQWLGQPLPRSARVRVAVRPAHALAA